MATDGRLLSEDGDDFPLSSVFTANQLALLFMFLLFFGTLALIWKKDATLRFARKKAYKGDMRVVRVNDNNPGLPDNTISSTKYTPLNFIFKALHVCFLQNVNRYCAPPPARPVRVPHRRPISRARAAQSCSSRCSSSTTS